VPPNYDTELIGDRPLNIDHNVFGRGLVMVSLNITSLFAHIDELRVYMNTSKIDVLTINETKLDSTIQNSEIYLSGFEIIRKDRKVNGRNGGGVCIFLRSNINYIMRDDLSLTT
jgi:exonuclease III